jgi:3-dehydroquinate synthase
MQGFQLQMQPIGSILTHLNRPSAALSRPIAAPQRVVPAPLNRNFNGTTITGPSAHTSRHSIKLAASGGVASDKMEIVEVDLGDRTYPIYIGSDILGKGELLRQHIPGKTVLIVTNTTIAPMYLERTIAAITAEGAIKVESVLLPDGEQYKSLDVVSKIWDKALEARLDRNTTFVALGGGVIGDMTGFAASAYQRGVHFIQIPTTVMSQVDSSVGGKTGVNHPLGKNMIGAFYQPRCVLIDTESLDTLPDRELASGLSEIIKYGLIRDSDLFEWLEANMDRLLARDPEAFKYAIERSCVNKAEVVAADEKEGGVRATLNLGHTFGHAIESATGYGAWLHGEAVGTGIVMAADMSRRLGWIDEALDNRIRALIEKAKLPVAPPAGMTVDQFKSFMAVDKKVQDGKLRLILLKGALGNCVITGEFEVQALEDTLAAFCSK